MITQIADYVTGDPAFAVDRDGVIVLWNQAAEKVLGYSSATALGRRCWELLCGHDTFDNDYCCEHCEVREMAFQHRQVNGFKAIYRTASGECKRFGINCLTVFDDQDNQLLLHVCHPEDAHIQFKSEPLTNNLHDVLTQREHQALVLLTQGKNNEEMATVMSISDLTVRNHVQHVLSKLNVHSRLEAVVVALKLDLI